MHFEENRAEHDNKSQANEGFMEELGHEQMEARRRTWPGEHELLAVLKVMAKADCRLR